MLAGRHGSAGNAMARLQAMGVATVPRSVLSPIPEETSGDLRAEAMYVPPPCKKPFNLCGFVVPVCKVIIFSVMEIFFAIWAKNHLDNCPGPSLYMLVFIGIAFLVIILEWWTNWVWRKDAPMLNEIDYCETPNNTAVQLEQQATLLVPPERNVGEGRHMEINTDYSELSQLVFEGPGNRMRIERPYMTNFIFLFILYFGALGSFIWGIIWIAAKKVDDKCTQNHLNWILTFIVAHIVMVVIRLLSFLKPHGTLCRACVRYRFWRAEECTSSIVVHFHNLGDLPNLQDGPGGNDFARTAN